MSDAQLRELCTEGAVVGLCNADGMLLDLRTVVRETPKQIVIEDGKKEYKFWKNSGTLVGAPKVIETGTPYDPMIHRTVRPVGEVEIEKFKQQVAA